MRRKSRNSDWYQVHSLPFLSIMLGLISVMALTSMAITFKRRDQKMTEQFVKLNNIPSNLIPLHIRCTPDSISWQDDRGKWLELNLGQMMGNSISQKQQADLETFLSFLEQKSADNHNLSYSNKQHTLILWIEPEGIMLAMELQAMISRFGLPLRVGQLPLLPNELIQKGGLGK